MVLRCLTFKHIQKLSPREELRAPVQKLTLSLKKKRELKLIALITFMTESHHNVASVLLQVKLQSIL